jgi:hypothetical protein
MAVAVALLLFRFGEAHDPSVSRASGYLVTARPLQLHGNPVAHKTPGIHSLVTR